MKTLASHIYRCTRGHMAASKDELPRCPAYHQGKPCDGELQTITENQWWTARASV